MEPTNKKSKMFGKSNYYKKKYFQQRKKHVLQAGQRGFLVTCNMNEKACVRECYNLLNSYADELYGPEVPEAVDSGSDDDLDAAVAKCKEAFAHTKVRFQNVDTGTTNCLFISTKVSDPVGLGKHIVEDISKTGKAMSRFIMRLVPIEVVCRANMLDITNAAGALFDKHFLKEPTTFGIIFNHRYNQQIKRDSLIKELAELVKKSIIVEVLRGWCLLSVIENYLECKKYNLAELTCPTVQKSKSDETAEQKSEEEAAVTKSKESAEQKTDEEEEKKADESAEQKSNEEDEKKQVESDIPAER